MTLVLFLVAVLILSVDIFLTGTVVGFLQKKTNIKQILYLQLVLAFMVASVLLFALVVGKVFLSFFASRAVWYASTLLFLLGLKLLYDGIRLHNLRKLINPTSPKGLFAIATFISLNALFVGLAFGFLNLNYTYVLYGLISFIAALIFGYFLGLKLKKLIAGRFEIVAAMVYIIMAILLLTKF